MFDLDLPELSEYEVSLYLSRTTAISAASLRIPDQYIKPDLNKVKGFDDRRFVSDLEKSHFQLLADSEWDVLLIDLIDERHATYVLNESALAYTKSSREYIDPLLKQGIGKLLPPLAIETVKRTHLALARISCEINKVRNSRPVYVHAARYATRYLVDGRCMDFPDAVAENSSKWNLFFDDAYRMLTLEDGFKNICVDERLCLAGGEHKWDLSPFHYDRSYYVELGKILNSSLRDSP